MKKLILIAVVIILTSCSVSRNVVFVDYTGFDCLITEANSVSFEYTPLGSVTANINGYTEPGDFSPYYDNASIMTHGNALRNTIKLAVDETKRKGGDGIINFKYEAIYKRSIHTGWFVSGMAIKIEK